MSKCKKRCLTTIFRCLFFILIVPAGAFGQAVLLSGWENPNELGANTATHGPLPAGPNANAFPPNGQGTTPINGDGLPLPLNLNGRWYVKDSNGPSPSIGTDVRIGQSTTVGVVSTDPDFPGSTGAIKITQGGSGRGVGDSHYNFTTAGVYLYEPFGPIAPATTGVLLDDARGHALRDARDNPGGKQFEFDVTFDVEDMIVRDPQTGAVQNWDSNPFLRVGFYMSNGIFAGGNHWVANDVLDPSCGCDSLLSGDQRFDLDDADPSDAPGSIPVSPITKHVVVGFPSSDWPILMDNGAGSLFQRPLLTLAGQTGPISAIAVGFIIDGNWAVGDVGSAGSSQSIYVDNLKLVNVPEPASVWLWLVGGMALAKFNWRRRDF